MPTFQSKTETTIDTNSLSFTGDKPAGVVEGDLLIAHLVTRRNDNNFPHSGPAGWVEVGQGRSTVNIVTSVWWKIAGASEPSSYTLTCPGSGATAELAIARYTNTDATTPINAASGSGSTLYPLTTPAVTSTVSDCLIIRFAGKDNGNELLTNPSGYTERWQFGAISTERARLFATEITQATAGSSGTLDIDWGNTSNRAWGAVTVAIAPAVVDETAPTVQSATIAANGTTLTVVFDEAVTGNGTGFTLDDTTAASYSSGDGTDTWVFALAREVFASETRTLSYNAAVGNVADTSANVLATFSLQAITNNSTVVPDETAPTLVSATVTSATSLSLVFDEDVTFELGFGAEDGMTLTASGGAATLEYASGAGTNTLVFTISRSIGSTESLLFSYDSVPGNITDMHANALASITNRLVTNNVSAGGGSGISKARLVNQGS